MEELIDIAAGIFGTTRELIFSKRKDRKTADARHSLIYFFVINLNTEISHAARSIGLNHSTGQAAMKEVRNLLETDSEFKQKYALFSSLAIVVPKCDMLVRASNNVIICDVISNKTFGFMSLEDAKQYMRISKNANYSVFEKVKQ